MIKPLSRKSFWLLILATPLMVVLVLSGIWVFSHTSTALYSPEPVTVVIRQGEALGSFVGRLAGDGIIRNPLFLKILAKIRRDANRIQAGEYIFQGRITPDEFLDILVEGHARLVQLTIPEGFNLADVAARLEELGLGNGKEFLRLSKNPEFIRQIEVPIQPARPNLEGYIFPETYHLHAGLDEGALLRAMVKQFAQQAAPLLKNVPPHLNMNPYQVLVLASIIEKETGAGHERPLISAVFHNRLKIKMPLQSDPTIIYG
ncbi:MAG: endolytic transglycosylase MltG, partial [Deltaproteobacteria bacterium]|nr:endolytic transglycosylase MltG [Deltaproteobacteria bacterium]